MTPNVGFVRMLQHDLTHRVAAGRISCSIGTSGKLDAVIDLEAGVRDASAPTRLLASYDTGDHLHLTPAGYKRMAEAVDLALFKS